TPCTYRARNPRPPARHAWSAAARATSLDRTYARKAGQSQYAARNTARGIVAPRRIGTGGVPADLTNTPAAPSTRITTNQSASNPITKGLTFATDSFADCGVGIACPARFRVTILAMTTSTLVLARVDPKAQVANLMPRERDGGRTR